MVLRELSGLTHGGAQGTKWAAGDGAWVSCLQGKLCYLSSPFSPFCR